MTKTKIKSIYFLRLLRNLFVLIGIFFSICIILALTTLPFWGYHWLGTSKSELKWEPKVTFEGLAKMMVKSDLKMLEEKDERF